MGHRQVYLRGIRWRIQLVCHYLALVKGERPAKDKSLHQKVRVAEVILLCFFLLVWTRRKHSTSCFLLAWILFVLPLPWSPTTGDGPDKSPCTFMTASPNGDTKPVNVLCICCHSLKCRNQIYSNKVTRMTPCHSFCKPRILQNAKLFSIVSFFWEMNGNVLWQYLLLLYTTLLVFWELQNSTTWKHQIWNKNSWCHNLRVTLVSW